MTETELRTELAAINKAIQEQNQATMNDTGNTIEDEYGNMEFYIQLLEEKIEVLEQLI